MKTFQIHNVEPTDVLLVEVEYAYALVHSDLLVIWSGNTSAAKSNITPNELKSLQSYSRHDRDNEIISKSECSFILTIQNGTPLH